MTRVSALFAGASTAAFMVASAAAQTIDLGTDQVGSVVNTTGTTLAKVISQNSPVTVRARAFAGPEAWMPEMDTGRIAIGVHLTASFYTAYNNFETKLHLKNLRVIRSSSGTAGLGFMTRADSDIKTVSDLKGKRVPGVYGGQPVIRVLVEATLKAYGLSYGALTTVPVINAVQGVAAVVDGRADASWASPSMPQIREAHAKVGVRFIPLAGISPAQEDEIRRNSFPSIYVERFGSAATPFLPPGTPLLTQEMYVGASTHTPDDVVKAVLKGLWDAEADLIKAHPVMRGFANRAAVTTRPVVPYHPAAIAFYKEKGVWTQTAEDAHLALLKK